MHRIHVVMVLLVFVSLSAARGQEQPRLRGFYVRSYLRDALPIADLPAHVDAPVGQLSLYADFEDIEGESITIYLVNRTANRIGFSAQDDDPYLKLEFVDGSGNWERAQPHYGSWCGNSYTHIPSLRPGEFFKTRGWYSSSGIRTTVRYRIFHDFVFVLKDDAPENTWRRSDLEELPTLLVSNSGIARVLPSAIEQSRTDGLASKYGSFETVRSLALGITKGPGLHPQRSAAVRELWRFPNDEGLALVLELAHDKARSVPGAAMCALAKMGLTFGPAEQAYQEFLTCDDLPLRVSATRALIGRPITPEVIEFAKGQLTHNELPVRVVAMSVIGMRCEDDPEIKAYINSMYNNPDPKIRSIFEMMLFPTTCIDYRERGRE